MEGQGSVARGHGDGSCLVGRIRRVMPSQVISKRVAERPEETRVAGGGVWPGLRPVSGAGG